MRRIYLDTSILGYSLSKREPRRKEEANLLLRQIRQGRFRAGYSFVMDEEIRAAPVQLSRRLRRKLAWSGARRIRVRSRSQVHDLADRYCSAGAIPREFFDDALHVAVATLWRADALVSYNFKHIVRLDTMVQVNEINCQQKLAELFLCQPSEVIER